MSRASASSQRHDIPSVSDGTLAPLGCVHGRFQVFHLDHLRYVNAALDRCERLLIGITSPEIHNLVKESTDADRSHASNNPLTFFERMVCIDRVLENQTTPRSRYLIVPFPIEEPSRLINYVPRHSVQFMTIYDDWGQEKAHRLDQLGYRVEVMWSSDEKGLAGRELRRKMTLGSAWRRDVPSAAADYYDSIRLPEKLRRVDDAEPR